MRQERKPTREALFTRYLVRALKRIITVAAFAFVLFLIVMLIIWAAPRVWHWALG